MELEVRIDKYLWAIRMYKTRAISADAINSKKVKLDKELIKPSRKVKIGDIYTVRREDAVIELKVIQLLSKRLSATLVQEYYTEISRMELNKPNPEMAVFLPQIYRDKGKGRPTKRERRDIDQFDQKEDQE